MEQGRQRGRHVHGHPPRRRLGATMTLKAHKGRCSRCGHDPAIDRLRDLASRAVGPRTMFGFGGEQLVSYEDLLREYRAFLAVEAKPTAAEVTPSGELSDTMRLSLLN